VGHEYPNYHRRIHRSADPSKITKDRGLVLRAMRYPGLVVLWHNPQPESQGQPVDGNTRRQHPWGRTTEDAMISSQARYGLTWTKRGGR
jgi:hypothetical protein